MSYMTTSERQSLLSAELASARTRALFVQALHRIADAFGFAHYTLMNKPSAEDLFLKPLVIETSLTGTYLREFDRAHTLRACPFSIVLGETVAPQKWNLSDPPTSEMFRCELRSLMLQHKMPVSVVLPVNGADGKRLVFWFSGDRAALSQSEMNELTVIVLHAFDAFSAVKRNEDSTYHALSARELEVVRWTAQGKTSVEIGQILALSDHTVNAYMTNAIKKLDCVNRTQLVAKAIRLKLIT
ncbi:helix-turn-helix transcriptional regulator [Rhizobium mongolense]|uniref:DNA-binding CsgD family transcriptional regulator n=1 Tax=Rhizobium mongolense USDA 1844 TaxID=1079460 RepID=A0A559SLG2_9HYPH|nr:LuxR C-terminal-related transcriptional regulator [Rhizobium mongolense]TVZ63200.1 DNA-binding CsgD family transcriptional regulator [Rhizobium mongolense USDA 1844]